VAATRGNTRRRARGDKTFIGDSALVNFSRLILEHFTGFRER
jgi:hypothetical protein